MEEEQKSGWALWVLIPICLVLTVMVTKWFLTPHKAAEPVGSTEQYTGGNADEVLAARNREDAQAESASAEAQSPGYQSASVSPRPAQAEPVGRAEPEQTAERPEPKPAARPKPARSDESADTTPAAAGRTPKEQRSAGNAYGYLSKVVGKLMNNPKAVSALLNNQYVVNGFMARASVKEATSSSAALAKYLKDPKNMDQFMNKPVVQSGLNNQALFDAVVGSKLANALLDTPGGKALLSDPSALSDIMTANPGLVGVLSNPKVMNALTRNPKTAGVVGQVMP